MRACSPTSRVAVAAAVAATATILALSAQAGLKPPSCAPPPNGSTPDNVVVVLLDVSQSTDSGAIRKSYSSDFTQRIAYALSDKGGALYGQSTFVVVGAIDQDDATRFHPLQCTYPKLSSDTNPLVFTYQTHGFNQTVARQATKIINGPRESMGTTLLDALTATSDLLNGMPAKHKYLVVFSDMVEYSKRLKMTAKTPLDAATTRKFIAKQRRDGDMPSLHGFRVYVAGAAATVEQKNQPDRDAVRKFWMTYFKAAGATLRRADYNGRLLRFP